MRVLLALLLVVAAGLPARASHVAPDDIHRGCPGGVDCSGGIASVQRPRFTEVAYLRDDDPVVGVAIEADARAYPVKVLDWHEIVNDRVGGEPIVVTYCPLCGSALAFSRESGARPLTFHVSGFLYRNDLVMWDEETEGLWTQILGERIGSWRPGDRVSTEHPEEALEILDSRIASWSEWRAAHPDTKVLARPRCGDGTTHPDAGCHGGEFQRDYDRYPYGSYREDRDVGVSGRERGDVAGLHPKTYVLGLAWDGAARAYPYPALEAAGVVQDELAGRPVLVTFSGSSAQAFDPGERRFTAADDGTMRDGEGREWDRLTGERVDGADRLEPVGHRLMFWFAWHDFHPGTEVWSPEGSSAAGPAGPDRVPLATTTTFLGLGLASLIARARRGR